MAGRGTSAAATYATAIAADGPLIYLPLQEATVNPTQAVGSYTLNLTNAGNISVISDGPMGGVAYRFSGAGASLTVSEALSNRREWSYECWYRPSTPAVGFTFLYRLTDGPVFLRSGGGQLQIHREGLTILGQTDNNYNDSTHWYYIVGWDQDDSGGGRFWVDGVNDSHRRDGYNYLNSGNPTYLFSATAGDIAHIAYYGRALTGVEVAAHYAAGAP